MPARTSVGFAGPGIILGLTVPLLAVGALRVPLGNEGIPLVVCFLLAGACLYGLSLVFGLRSVCCNPGLDTQFLAVSMLAFWTWHLFAAMRSIGFEGSMLEHVRLTIGMVCFAVLLSARRVLAGAMGQVWGISIVVSSILLAALVFRYAIVFGMPYLGNDWSVPTRLGKNQLGWFLAVTMPFVLVRYACAERGWRYLLPAIIHVLAWLYVASRGSWACGAVGTVVALGYARSGGMTRRAWVRFLVLAGVMCCAALLALGFAGLPVKTADLDIVTRLMGPGSLDPAQHSNRLRWELVKYYADLFAQSPLFGIGLRNSLYGGGYVSHNDVLAILAEQGLLGFAMFVAMIGMVVRMIMATPATNWCAAASRGAAVSLVAYLLLINAYVSPMFWILLALVVLSGMSAGVVGRPEIQASCARDAQHGREA